jgi:hypothetical protein
VQAQVLGAAEYLLPQCRLMLVQQGQTVSSQEMRDEDLQAVLRNLQAITDKGLKPVVCLSLSLFCHVFLSPEFSSKVLQFL